MTTSSSTNPSYWEVTPYNSSLAGKFLKKLNTYKNDMVQKSGKKTGKNKKDEFINLRDQAENNNNPNISQSFFNQKDSFYKGDSIIKDNSIIHDASVKNDISFLKDSSFMKIKDD